VDIVSIVGTRIEIDQDRNRYNYNNNDSTYENSCKQAIYFLICGSCDWCASCIGLNAPLRCPSCDDSKVERISIAHGEIQRFDVIVRDDISRILFDS
jgi:hypothetical protein